MPSSTAGATASAISWQKSSCFGAPNATSTMSGDAARSFSTMGARVDGGFDRSTIGASVPTMRSVGCRARSFAAASSATPGPAPSK